MIEDVDALLKQLRDLGAGAQEAVPDAADRGAHIVAAEMRRRAPRKTGKLANSIRVERGKPRGKSDAVAEVGPDNEAPYSTAVELGYSIVRDGRVVGHVPAKPFMRPAYEQNKERVTEVVGNVIAKELDKIADG